MCTFGAHQGNVRFPTISTLSALFPREIEAHHVAPNDWTQGSQPAHDLQASAQGRGIIVGRSEQLLGFQCRLGLS